MCIIVDAPENSVQQHLQKSNAPTMYNIITYCKETASCKQYTMRIFII